MKSPIRWVGGKRWLATKVKPYLNGCKRFVEPFAGGAGISFSLEMPNVFLRDTNSHLVNFYLMLQKHGYMQQLNLPYNDVRDLINSVDSRDHPLHWASWFYFINHSSFCGLWRENKDGHYNVPKGDKKPVYTGLLQASELMKFWRIECGPYHGLEVEDGDVIYLDPPYIDTFNKYGAGGFNEHEELALWASRLDVPVIASNSIAAKELWADYGFDVEEIEAPRRINRQKATELFMTRGFK